MTVTDLQSRSVTLRGELKAWEKVFEATHDGRKACREEIKKDGAIAAKYKEYNKIRELIAGNSKPVEPQHLRTPTEPLTKQLFETPSKKTLAGTDNTVISETVQSPIQLGTPAIQRAFVGPTPQKDGVFLGLFDLIPDHGHTLSSKLSPTAGQRPILGQIHNNAVPVTPSKIQHGLNNTHSSFQKFSRTPQPAGKRFLLDTFVTPSKRRRTDVGDFPTPEGKDRTHLCTTRSSDAHFSTPSFLRRDSQRLDTVPEAMETRDDESIFMSAHSTSPSASRTWIAPTMRRRKGMTRSLSSMIAEMRAQEEERMDEGMDVLREIEEEEEDQRLIKPPPRLLVKDSQAFGGFAAGEDEHRLGPDGAVEENDEEDQAGLAKEGLGPGGVPLRVWKKKGLKRQTKRVLMRPIARPATRDAADTSLINFFDIDTQELEANDDSPETIAETQPQANGNDEDNDDDGDFQATVPADNDSEDETTSVSRISKRSRGPTHTSTSTSTITAPAKAPTKANVKVKKTLAKTAKKLSSTAALAHTNFRRLKIRSSKGAAGATSGGEFRGKFGRGRR